VYCEEDPYVKSLGEKYRHSTTVIPYSAPVFTPSENGTLLEWEGKTYSLNIFGRHNLQNGMGAMHVAAKMGITNEQFLISLSDFKGAGKRLQKVCETGRFIMFKDFAHSPSKLKATTSAVKHQFPDRKLVACMELHTFSSLQKDFLPHYEGCMSDADEAVVYFNPEVVKHKKLPELSIEEVKNGFGGNVLVLNDTQQIRDFLDSNDWNDCSLLMMSSGNFDGIDFDLLGKQLTDTLS
jgi:UDP-N-acetylmuramate: L-alanyl-gamma-D-glutamyl-meso-diaminopimelate ligase